MSIQSSENLFSIKNESEVVWKLIRIVTYKDILPVRIKMQDKFVKQIESEGYGFLIWGEILQIR